MSSSPYKTCPACGESHPITEMRAIRESFVTGQTSGRLRVSGSAGSSTSTSMGSGQGPRLSSSRRNSTAYTTGTTQTRFGERFYCIANGCYTNRIEQIKQAAVRVAARKRIFRLLVLLTLLTGAGYIAYKNGTIARLIAQVSGPSAPQVNEPAPAPRRHHHADRSVADVASIAAGPSPVAGAGVAEQSDQAIGASGDVGPTNQPALADAVDSALTSGEVVRWHAADGAVSGEVSVSASQSYADRECRSYRYTVRGPQGVFTSPGAIGCAVDGGQWSYRQQPK